MKYLTISSADRTNSTDGINDFEINLDNMIQDVVGIESMEVLLYHQWYTVNTTNNKIYFKVSTTTYTATLTTGNYIPSTLVTEIQTQMNSAYTPDNNFTCTYSSSIGKVTVTHSATNFQLMFSTNTTASARKLLGFNAEDTVAGLTVTSTNLIDLNCNRNLFLVSRALTNDYSLIADNRMRVLLPIPVTTTFGGLIQWRSYGDKWTTKFTTPQNFQVLDFKLYQEDLTNLVPMNGIDWRITLRLMEEKD